MRAGIARTQTGGSPIPPLFLSLEEHTARDAAVNRRTGTATGAVTAVLATEHTEITENENGQFGGRHDGLTFPLT